MSAGPCLLQRPECRLHVAQGLRRGAGRHMETKGAYTASLDGNMGTAQ